VSRGWRLATMGVIFVALFAVLVLRLWYLQVSTQASALETVEEQQLRVVTVEAPRGDVYDSKGRLLAGTRASLRIIVDRKLVPSEREEELIDNLATLLDIPASSLRARFEDQGVGARFSVGGEVTETIAVFAQEHMEDFPGVVVEPVPVRVYPEGETAAHVIGYIGAPSDQDLRRPDITPRDRVGRFGVEREYDSQLRGTPGRITYRVNAAGEILGVVDEVPAVAGGTVVTTIDLELQKVVEKALLDGMSLARRDGQPVVRGAGVVIDPRDGSVLAMASVPGYDPALFIEGQISEEQWAALSEQAALNNFAIQGLYPPASTFKVVPYTLAIENSIYPTVEQDQYANRLDPNDPTSFYADGELQFPNTPLLKDWKVHGLVNIHTSLQVSSDNYYWGIALEIWERAGIDWPENILADWARLLGFGADTGIDLPFEQTGIVPDREWFQYQQRNKTGLVRSEGGWSGGDVMNMAIGQGSMSCTPLQLANAFGALVNGGTLWRPRVVSSIRDADNEIVFTNPASVIREIPIADSTVASLRADLHGVVASTIGTAYSAFQGFGPGLDQVGGKTGTAEIKVATAPGEKDVNTAWFVGVAPLDNPQYIVVIVLEQGGSGGKIAAPTGRAILQYLMGGSLAMDPVIGGEDTD
jgi:penicillin-binding protein 2